MNFKPKTEDECHPLLEKGEYGFEIIASTDKLSKNGNEMIEMKVRLYSGERCVGQVFDYLMEAVAYKLRHCSAACGLLKEYETGTLTGDMFLGCSGKALVGIEKPKDDKYRERNKIDDYVVPENYVHKSAKVPPVATAANTPGLGDTPPTDDLPF